ncbi:MAG: DUF885 domain-containing protein [Gemmatimonadetes bacterium]|nr:DUF885 domain-containing protein [Gemmatimonadota bacterium]
MTANRAFEDLTNSYLDLRWQFDPVQATAAGRSEFDQRLGSFGLQAVEENLAALRSIAKAIEELSFDSVEDELDRTALLNQIRVTVNRYTHERPHVRNPEFWLSHLLQGLYFLLVRDDRPVAHRAAAAARRLEAVPSFLEQAKQTLHDCPSVFVDTGLGVINGGLGLIHQIGEHLCPEGDDRFDGIRDAAVAALQTFAKDLPAKAMQPEDGGFAIGEEAFNFRLQFEHALGSSANELRAYGNSLVDEVELALAELARDIDPGVVWPDLADRLRDDHPSGGDVVNAYVREMERARLFVEERGIVPVYPGRLEVVETPSFLLPMIPVAAYQPPGAFAEDRTGLFYVTPPAAGLDDPSKQSVLRNHCEFEIAPTALHEGYPGHHLQFLAAHAQPRVVRKLMGSALVYEGWALYCEEMMGEEGFYRQAEERFFQLIALLLRGIRVLVDVGLHAGGMSYDEAVQLLIDRAVVGRRTAEAEVRRYCATPTYQLCYAVGRREIKALHTDFRNGAGADYSLRDFHDAVLGYGGLPVSLMRWGMGLNR